MFLAVPAMITLILQVKLCITTIQTWTPLPQSPELGDTSQYVEGWNELLRHNPEPFLLMESFSPAVFQHRCIAADCWSFSTARIFTLREQRSLHDLAPGRRICFTMVYEQAAIQEVLSRPWMQAILADRQVIWRSNMFVLYGLPGEIAP